MSRLLVAAVVLAVAGLVAADRHDVSPLVEWLLSLALLGAWAFFVGRGLWEALRPIDDEVES